MTIKITKITEPHNQSEPMLNLQSLDRQFFWVERPKAVVAELKRHFKNVEDVSYINDGTPSVLVDDEYLVFLPNSFRGHEEETNEYMVCKNADYGMLENNFTTHDTLDRVIDEIVELKSKEIKTALDFRLHIGQCIQELKNDGDSHDHSRAVGMQVCLDLFEEVHRNYVKEMQHRMEMVIDDLNKLVDHMRQYPMPDSVKGNIHNIEVACDLTNDECLCWKSYKKKEK